MKKAKILFPILLSAVSIGLFAGAFVGQKNNGEAAIVKAEAPTATFAGLAGAWNPAAHSGTNERYIFNFAENLGENNAVNYCADIGDHFQINGESLKSISTSLRIGHNNQGADKLFVDIPTAKIVPTADYPVPMFHIDGGTPFQDYLLPDLTFTVDASTYVMTQVVELTYSSYKNNEDFTSPHPSGITYSGSAPSNGAMIGVVFNEASLNHAGSDVEDHTSTWGKNIFVNEHALADVDGAVVGVYANRLYIFVPSAYLTFVNPGSQTIHSTVFIKRAIYGSCIIPTMSFFWNGTVGAGGGWTKQNSPAAVEFNDIRWNGVDYGTYDNHKGILLRYKSNLAQRGEYYQGGLNKINLINHPAFNIGANIKLNGVAFKDINDAEVYYHSEQNLWIYAPEMGTKGNVLEIKDVMVMDSFLPNQNFLFNTSWAVVDEDVFGNVNQFVETYMHMDANVNGQCETYYPLAKAAYASLSADAKMVFINNATFTSAFNRLAAWATYHNETFNGTTFATNSNRLLSRSNVNSGALVTVIIASSIAMLSLLAGFITLKRKHKEY